MRTGSFGDIFIEKDDNVVVVNVPAECPFRIFAEMNICNYLLKTTGLKIECFNPSNFAATDCPLAYNETIIVGKPICFKKGYK